MKDGAAAHVDAKLDPDHPAGPSRISPASRRALAAVRRRVLASSVTSDWQDVLVDHHVIDDPEHDLVIPGTPDLTVKAVLRGGQRLGSRHASGWRERDYRRGDTDVTAPHEVRELRRRRLAGHMAVEKVTVVVAADLVAEAVDDHCRAGHRAILPVGLPGGDRDPVVTALASRLARAAGAGASGLLADSAALCLVHHLLEPSVEGGSVRRESASSRRRRLRVEAARELIHTDHARPLTLEDLSTAAHLSRFELLRTFRDVHGVTPHAYLRSVRLDAARRLLRSTDLPVAVVAGRCGFRSASHFSAAYADRFGRSPSMDRR